MVKTEKKKRTLASKGFPLGGCKKGWGLGSSRFFITRPTPGGNAPKKGPKASPRKKAGTAPSLPISWGHQGWGYGNKQPNRYSEGSGGKNINSGGENEVGIVTQFAGEGNMEFTVVRGKLTCANFVNQESKRELRRKQMEMEGRERRDVRHVLERTASATRSKRCPGKKNETQATFGGPPKRECAKWPAPKMAKAKGGSTRGLQKKKAQKTCPCRCPLPPSSQRSGKRKGENLKTKRTACKRTRQRKNL